MWWHNALKDLIELFSKHFNRINQSAFFFFRRILLRSTSNLVEICFSIKRYEQELNEKIDITTKPGTRWSTMVKKNYLSLLFFHFQWTVIIFDFLYFLSLRLTITFLIFSKHWASHPNELKWRVRHWFSMNIFSLRENRFYLFHFSYLHLFWPKNKLEIRKQKIFPFHLFIISLCSVVRALSVIEKKNYICDCHSFILTSFGIKSNIMSVISGNLT